LVALLRIYLTGEICLWASDRVVTAERLPGRQGRLAFAYLVCERTRPVPRSEVIDAVWPERVPDAYDVALSALVSKLRTLFEEVGVARGSLSAADGCYQLKLPPGVWVDTEAALAAVHAAEGAVRASAYRNAYGPAVVASAILRRPFLPGAEGDWVDARRAALRQVNLRALTVLAEVHAWNGETALAVRAAEDAIALEPFRESAYLSLMRVHYRAGDRAEALRVYERCRRFLADELGARPGPETEQVRAQLAAD
jgi:DNA-binding SARP family transcriptional activator